MRFQGRRRRFERKSLSDIIRAQKLTKIQTTTHFVALFDKLEKQWKRKVSPKVKLA